MGDPPHFDAVLNSLKAIETQAKAELMSNFTFLPADYRSLAEAAKTAESHVFSDARGACFHARFALETAVHWLYRYDQSLKMPYDQSLGALPHAPSFQRRVPRGDLPEGTHHPEGGQSGSAQSSRSVNLMRCNSSKNCNISSIGSLAPTHDQALRPWARSNGMATKFRARLLRLRPSLSPS